MTDLVLSYHHVRRRTRHSWGQGHFLVVVVSVVPGYRLLGLLPFRTVRAPFLYFFCPVPVLPVASTPVPIVGYDMERDL